jgi:hypothetical protein
LIITAPQALCTDGTNEFHLHYYRSDGFIAYVIEAAAGPSACEWQINDLGEGRYEALIQIAPDGRMLARADVQVIRGVVSLMVLQPPAVEVRGQVRGTLVAPTDLDLWFKPEGSPPWLNAKAEIGSDGDYKVTLDGQTDSYCAWVSARSPANHLSKCGKFSPGLRQLDLEVAPGVIHVTVPPFQHALGEWAEVDLRPKRSMTLHDTGLLVTQGGSASFKSKDGFQGDYIGIAYGDYVVSVILCGQGVCDEGTHRVVSAPLTISPDDMSVTLSLSPP